MSPQTASARKPDAAAEAAEAIRRAQKTMEGLDDRHDARNKVNHESPKGFIRNCIDGVKGVFIAAHRINKIYDAVKRAYEFIKPAIDPTLRASSWAAGQAKDIFNYAAYEHKNGKMVLDNDGDPIFSPGRLARSFSVAVGVALAANIGIQATYYHATEFNETVYITGKQLIEAGEKYEFSGCTSLPCSSELDNGKYYRIEKGYIYPWLVYPEQKVFANIPQQGGACDVHGYGIYFKDLKFIFRKLEWYQQVDQVACRPYTQAEIDLAVGSGKIVAPPMLNHH